MNPDPNTNLLLENAQFWVLVVGSLVPLIGYVINRYAPWVDETIKAVVQVVVAAAGAAAYQAIELGTFGWNNETFQLVLSGVVAALAAHNFLWKPAKVNTKLGATERTVVGE